MLLPSTPPSRFALSYLLFLGLIFSGCSKSSSAPSDPVAPPATNVFSVGGMLSGLPTGESVTLQNNGEDDLVLTVNGAFSFATSMADGATFDVQVAAQPASANCVITVGTGTIAGANVANVIATCTANPVSPGALDPSFNPSGTTPGVVIDDLVGVGGGVSAGLDSVIDANGKIVVCGHGSGINLDMVIWRLNTDGSLDTTFNAAGSIPGVASHHNAAGGDALDQGRALTIDASGRILVTGISRAPFTFGTAIWRFNANGTLDTSFNAAGPVPGTIVSLGSGGGNGSEQGEAIVVDSNGKILVAGVAASSLSNSQSDMVIWRFNDDGTPDTSFNSSGAKPGIFVFDAGLAGGGDEFAKTIELDATNRILVAGRLETANGEDLAIWRIEANGVLDSSFNATGANPGRISLNLASDNFNRAEDVHLDAAGRIYVAGSVGKGVLSDSVLLRFTADGTLDTTFNAGGFMPGIVFHNDAAGGNADDAGVALVQDDDDNLLIVGTSRNLAGDFDQVIWRYTDSGVFDTTFNADGATPGLLVNENLVGSDSDEFPASIAIDASGKILVAGSVGIKAIPFGISRMTVLRLNR